MNPYADILLCARAGNPARALRICEKRGLDLGSKDPKGLTLLGRLLKDKAFRSDASERPRLLRKSAKAYLAAFALEADSYPLINAASLMLMAGAVERSRELAGRVLEMIEADPRQGETAYWREATRAEGLLLLGRQEEAERALAAAIGAAPLAHEDRAATIGQFERILDAQGNGKAWLLPYRVPATMYFSGLIELDASDRDLLNAIHQSVADIAPSYAFGALAAGADILLAEEAKSAGAQLHVTLPCSIEEFRERSVLPFGNDWPDRYDKLIADAVSVETLPTQLREAPLAFPLAIKIASLVAMGQSLRHADVLRSQPHALVIAGRGEDERQQVLHWKQLGKALRKIETDRVLSASKSDQPLLLAEAQEEIIGVIAIKPNRSGGFEEAINKLSLNRLDGGDTTLLSGAAERCLAAAQSLIAMNEGYAVGLVLDAGEVAKPAQVMIERASWLAQVNEGGHTTTDWQSAFVSRVLSPDLTIEELGELSSVMGPIPLWSLH